MTAPIHRGEGTRRPPSSRRTVLRGTAANLRTVR